MDRILRTSVERILGLDGRKRVRNLCWSVLEADPALGALTRSIDCRSRTCRVQISDDHQDSRSIDQSLLALAQTVVADLTNLEVDRLDDGRGGTSMVLFLTEESPPPSSAPQ